MLATRANAYQGVKLDATMAEDDKKVDTTPTEEPPKEPQPDVDAAGKEPEESAVTKEKPSDNDIDYKAEYEREKSAREKAEKAIANAAFKAREDRRNTDDDDEPAGDDDDKPLTKRELQNILAADRQLSQKQLREDKIADLARDLSGSEDEAGLVVEIHRNRVFPDHLTLKEQVEEAWAIANRKRLMGENSELKRALRSKDAANKSAAGAHHDAPPGAEPQMAAADRQALVAVGFAFNATSRRWEKKLRNGDVLVRDPKTKQTTVIRSR